MTRKKSQTIAQRFDWSPTTVELEVEDALKKENAAFNELVTVARDYVALDKAHANALGHTKAEQLERRLANMAGTLANAASRFARARTSRHRPTLAKPRLLRSEQKHVDFVRGTLIPDLHESGYEPTAETLEALCAIIDRLTGKAGR